MDAGTLYGLGIALIFTGMFIIIIAAILLLLMSVRGKEKVRGGGVIIIGPFPIIFGTDKESVKTVLLLSLTVTILLVIITVILYLLSK